MLRSLRAQYLFKHSYIYNRGTDNDRKYELTYSNLCELISNVEQLDEANKTKYLTGIDYLIALDTGTWSALECCLHYNRTVVV